MGSLRSLVCARKGVVEGMGGSEGGGVCVIGGLTVFLGAANISPSRESGASISCEEAARASAMVGWRGEGGRGSSPSNGRGSLGIGEKGELWADSANGEESERSRKGVSWAGEGALLSAKGEASEALG